MKKELFCFASDIFSFAKVLLYLIFVRRFRKGFDCLRMVKPLMIVGNGPSASLAFDKLKLRRDERHLCTVNFSILTKEFFEMKPEMHFFADPYFFTHVDDERVKNVLKNIAKIDWDIMIFVPSHRGGVFEDFVKRNAKIHLVRFYGKSWEPQGKVGKWLRMKLYCKNLLMPRLQNVVIACIFCAMHLGYSEIDLYGVEHSWLNDISVNEENQVCLIDRHFYGDKKIPWKKNDCEIFKMHEILKTLAFTFEGYWDLKEIAQKKNIRIVNMTENSFIDAFERGKV